MSRICLKPFANIRGNNYSISTTHQIISGGETESLNRKVFNQSILKVF